MGWRECALAPSISGLVLGYREMRRSPPVQRKPFSSAAWAAASSSRRFRITANRAASSFSFIFKKCWRACSFSMASRSLRDSSRGAAGARDRPAALGSCGLVEDVVATAADPSSESSLELSESEVSATALLTLSFPSFSATLLGESYTG